jgi:hypothetical protein
MIEAFVQCSNLDTVPRWKAEASVAIFLSWILYFVYYDVILNRTAPYRELRQRLVVPTSLEELGESLAQPSMVVVSINGKFGSCQAAAGLEVSL